MKIKIDTNGNLYIKRGASFKLQECPFHEEVIFCSDACPLFNDSDIPNSLELCRAYYDDIEVEDNRK